MDVKIVKAASQVLVDEIRALLSIYEITGKIPADRLEGIKTRIAQIERMLT